MPETPFDQFITPKKTPLDQPSVVSSQPTPFDQFIGPTAKPEDGYLSGIARSAYRGVAEIGVQAGKAAEYNAEHLGSGTNTPESRDQSKLNIVNKAGKFIADKSEQARDLVDPASFGDNELKRSAFQAVESFPLSAAYAIPSYIGAGIGAASGLGTAGTTSIPGAIAGAVIGQAPSAAVMYRAQAQQASEDLDKLQQQGKLRDGVTNADKLASAQKSGVAEFGGESLSDVAESVLFSRLPFLKTVATTAKGVLRPGLKEIAKTYAGVLAAEQLGEGGTAAAQTAAQNELLKPENQQSILDAVKYQAGPTTVMSTLMMGLGSAKGHLDGNAIAKKIESEATPPEERLQAANFIAGRLKETNGPEAAKNFLDHSVDAILNPATPNTLDLNDPALLQPSQATQGMNRAQEFGAPLSSALGTAPPATTDPSSPDAVQSDIDWEEQQRAALLRNQTANRSNPAAAAEADLNAYNPPTPERKFTDTDLVDTADLMNGFADSSQAAQDGEDVKYRRNKFERLKAENIQQPNNTDKVNPDYAHLPEETRAIMPALDSMAQEISAGQVSKSFQNAEGDTSPTVSSYPDWFKQRTIREYNKKTGQDISLSRENVNRILSRVKEGKPLIGKQPAIFDYLKSVAEEKRGSDPAVMQQDKLYELSNEGFQFEKPKDISVGSLAPGDQVVIEKNGVPDKLHHKGYDAKGNAILQDGVTMHVDPFEQIQVIAQRSGDSKITPEEQQRISSLVGDIRNKATSQDLDRMQSEIEPFFKQNPHLEPYRKMVEGAIQERRNTATPQAVEPRQVAPLQSDETRLSPSPIKTVAGGPAGEGFSQQGEQNDTVQQNKDSLAAANNQQTGAKVSGAANGDIGPGGEVAGEGGTTRGASAQNVSRATPQRNTGTQKEGVGGGERGIHERQSSGRDKRGGQPQSLGVGRQQSQQLNAAEATMPAATPIIEIKAEHGRKVGNVVALARANKQSISLPEAYRRAGEEMPVKISQQQSSKDNQNEKTSTEVNAETNTETNASNAHEGPNANAANAEKGQERLLAKSAPNAQRNEGSARENGETPRQVKNPTGAPLGATSKDQADEKNVSNPQSIAKAPAPVHENADGSVPASLHEGVQLSDGNGTVGKDAKLSVAERGKAELTPAQQRQVNRLTKRGMTETDARGNVFEKQVERELRDFLGDGYDNLVSRGKLKVVRSQKDTPFAQDIKSGKVAGMYAGKTIYIVTDNVKPGEAKDVLIHEIAHALWVEDKIFRNRKDVILKDFIALGKTNPAVKEALSRVPKDTASWAVDEENLSYFLENPANRNHNIVRRIISAIKASLYRMGFTNMKLSESDLVALFTQGVKSWAKRTADQDLTKGRGLNEILSGIGEFAQPAMMSVKDAARKIQNLAAFKKWFGDSKVVDEHGEPLVVYHGTSTDISNFKMTDIGVHFGSESQANNRLANKFKGESQGQRIIPVYLSIKNPLRLKADIGAFNYPPDVLATLSIQDVTGIGFVNKERERRKQVLSNLERKHKVYRSGELYFKDDLSEKAYRDGESVLNNESFDKIRTAIMAKGYDGIVYSNNFEGYGDSYISFDPTQIKSIFNNQWDGSNPDILKSTTGQTKTPEFRYWLGQSKITRDGNPEVLYHGTNDKRFLQDKSYNWTFDPNRAARQDSSPFAGLGIFLGNESIAMAHSGGNMAAVHPFYVRVENPLIIDSADLAKKVTDLASAKTFRARAMDLEGHDGIIIKDRGQVIAFEPNQLKSATDNTGEFSRGNDEVRYSIASSFTGTIPRSFGIVQEYMNRSDVKERFESLASYLWDRDAAISRVQKEIGPQPETRDYNLLRRLTGKKVSDEIALFDRDKLKPLLKEMAAAKIKFDDVGELAWAEHAPERNLQMKRVNAKRYIDNFLQNFTDKEKEKYQERLGRIQDEFVMNDQTRNERRDSYIRLMDDLSIINEPAERQRIADMQATLDNRTFTKEEQDNDGPEKAQKRIDNATNRLEQRLQIAAKWNDVKDRLSGMTNEEAKVITDKWKADGRYAGIRSVIDKMRAINEAALDMNYAAGELTEDEYNAIKNTYKFHVPLYREDMDEGKAPTGKVGVGPLASPIKIASGSTKKVVDIFPHIVDRYQAAINRKHKLEAGKILYEMVRDNPDESRWSLVEQEKKPYLDNEGNIRFYTDQQINKEIETQVKVDGKKYIIAVPKENKSMLRWMQALNREPVELGPMVKASRKVTQLLAALNTTASPEFLLTNFARDIQTAGIHLQSTDAQGMQGKVLKNIKSAIKGIFHEERGTDSGEWGAIYRDFAKNGGKISWMQGYENVEELAKNLESELAYEEGKKPLRSKYRSFAQFVGAMNTAVENGVRLATYKALLDSGATPRKAAHAAANLTVDFTRSGTVGPFMNSLFMFANAGIQGNVRMLNALAKNRSVQKIAAGIVGFGFAANILGAYSGGDDDDGEAYYDKLKRKNPDLFERNMVFMIPGTNGKHIKIPMPYGYNTMFVAGNELASALRGGTTYKFTDGMARLGSALMGTFNPLGSATLLQTITPTVFDPVAMVMENKQWNGQALMPEASPFGLTKPDSERFFKSVNPIARFATQWINRITGGNENRSGVIDVSPETIDMIVETFTGSLGKLAKDSVSLPILAASGNLEMHKVPFARKVFGQKSDFVDSSVYRDNRDEIKLFEKEYDSAKPEDKRAMRDDSRYQLVEHTKETEKRLRSMRKRADIAKNRGDDSLAETIEGKMRNIYSEYNKRYNESK